MNWIPHFSSFYAFQNYVSFLYGIYSTLVNLYVIMILGNGISIQALVMRWNTMIVPIIKWWIWQFFADAFKLKLHCDGASKFLVYWHCIWLKVTAKKSCLIAWTTDTHSFFFPKVPTFSACADKLRSNLLRHLDYFWPNYQSLFWYCEFLVHDFH